MSMDFFRRKTPEKFYEHLQYEREYRPITIQNYKSILTRILRDLGNLSPKPRQAEEYLLEMRKKLYSASHINNTTVIIENYLKFLRRRFKKFDRVKKPKPTIKETLTEGEIARVLAAGKDSREQAMVAVLAYTGLRNRELCNLRVKDVDFEKGLVRVINGKAGKSGVSYLAREGLQIVGRYLGEYPKEDKEWLFTTLVRGNQYVGCDLRKMVKVLAKRAKIEKRVYPHLFRHSLATNLIKNGANVITVQNQLRHEKLDTTMIYIRSFPQRVQDEYQYFVPRYL
jgi:integrase/recombinase XerD